MSNQRKYLKHKKKNCEVCGLSDNEWCFLNYNYKCMGLSVHHIFPKNKGGSDNITNLLTVCEKCHRKKHTIDGKLNWFMTNESGGI